MRGAGAGTNTMSVECLSRCMEAVGGGAELAPGRWWWGGVGVAHVTLTVGGAVLGGGGQAQKGHQCPAPVVVGDVSRGVRPRGALL